MSDELLQIKNRIYKEDRIKELLEKLGCWSIETEQNGKLIVAALPDGDNRRSIQVKNNEFLTTAIRSKGIYGSIYDLVSFVAFDSQTEDERKKTLHKSKVWICKKLNYLEFIDPFYQLTSDIESVPNVIQEIAWLKEFKKKKKKTVFENKVYPNKILQQYDLAPHIRWLNEGLSIKTQLKFGVGFDIRTDRIIFPIHNTRGELIGVKGRYIGNNKEIEEARKYLYLVKCNKSIELFNYHRAAEHIASKDEVIVVEGAKTTMFLDQWGYSNCVSIEGDHLTDSQVELIKNFGFRTKIIFAWDKDKDVPFISEQLKRFKGRQVYVLYDRDDQLFDEKDSPTDKGQETFEILFHKYKFAL